MSNCSNCGEALQTGAKFCPSCGTRAVASAATGDALHGRRFGAAGNEGAAETHGAGVSDAEDFGRDREVRGSVDHELSAAVETEREDAPGHRAGDGAERVVEAALEGGDPFVEDAERARREIRERRLQDLQEIARARSSSQNAAVVQRP